MIEEEDRGDRIRSTGTSQVRMFSKEAVLQIAIASRLRTIGVPVRDSLLAGMRFVLFGEQATGKPARAPGQPFPSGDTFLVIAPGEQARVVNASPAGDSAALWHVIVEAGLPISTAFERGETAIAPLDVGAVYREVMQKLGFSDPEEGRA